MNERIEKKGPDKFSVTGRVKSFGFAFKGILSAIKSEHNLWIQTIVAILVICCGFYFHISLSEWLFVIFAIGLVLSAEMFNTAIEGLVDLVSPDYNKKAGYVKDVAAGAVLVAAITAAIVGIVVFLPYILDF